MEDRRHRRRRRCGPSDLQDRNTARFIGWSYSVYGVRIERDLSTDTVVFWTQKNVFKYPRESTKLCFYLLFLFSLSLSLIVIRQLIAALPLRSRVLHTQSRMTINSVTPCSTRIEFRRAPSSIPKFNAIYSTKFTVFLFTFTLCIIISNNPSFFIYILYNFTFSANNCTYWLYNIYFYFFFFFCVQIYLRTLGVLYLKRFVLSRYSLYCNSIELFKCHHKREIIF